MNDSDRHRCWPSALRPIARRSRAWTCAAASSAFTASTRGAATSASGCSEQPAIAALATALPPLLRGLKVASLLDAPCGDALWINRLNGPARRAL
jgi:hypothetical protein